MASLRDLIETQHNRTPTALVYVAGVQRQVRNSSGAISLNGSFGQPISGGSIQLVNVPDSQAPQHKDPVVLRLGYNGQTVPVLTGFVTSIARAAYPRGYTITVSDVLWIADFGLAPETDITIPNLSTGLPNNVSAHEVIQRLLFEWAGIPQEYLYIPQLCTDDAGTNDWMLGQLTPLAFGNSSPLQAALDVATPLGYWLFCDGAGVVRLVNLGGAPSGQAFRVLQEGRDFLVKGPPAMASDSSQIFTRVVVTGADTGFEGTTLKDSWQVESPFLPGGKYRETSYSNALLEYLNPDDVTANGTPAGLSAITSVAKRLLAEKSRAPRAITVQIKGDPRLGVGMTIAIKSPRLGIPNATNFFIYALSTSFGGGDYTQTLTLDGGTGEGGYTLIPAPMAAFSWVVHLEFMEAGEQIEVFVDGTTSASLGGGEIIAWHWEAPGATPTAGDGAQFMFSYPGGTAEATITLTVTDANGKINSITNTIDLTETATRKPTRRVLNFAAQTAWYVTPDGGETWNIEATGTASAVPPIGAEGSILADQTAAEALGLLATGQGAKALRSTADDLATPSTQLGGVAAAAGPITFIWQHEKDAQRIWVAAGSAVYLSINGGTSFGPARTPPVPAGDTDKTVRWVVESQDQIGVIDVLAGRHAWTSYDSGIHWEERLEVESAAVMRCYASGHERHWVGCTGMPAEAIPLRTLEGDTAAFIDGTGPISPPTDIRALTLMVTQPVLYAIDGTGKIWSGDASSGQDMAIVATMPPPQAGGTTPVVSQMMVRDGDYPVIYIAADDGLYKLYPGPNTVGLMKLVDVAAGQAGRFVGYGSIAGRVVVAVSTELYIPTTVEAVPGGVWHITPPGSGSAAGVWTLLNTGLPSGVAWRHIAASPLDPDVMILLGGLSDYDIYPTGGGVMTMGPGVASPLWVTSDGGLHWAAAPVRAPADATQSYNIFAVEFSRTTPGRWYMTGQSQMPGGTRMTRWQGTLTTAEDPWWDEDQPADIEWQTAGDAEDTITSWHGPTGSQGVMYIPTPPTPHGTGITPQVQEIGIVTRPSDPDKPTLDVSGSPATAGRVLWALEGQRSNNHRLWYTPDYRSVTIKLIGNVDFFSSSGASAGFVTAVGDDALIASGNTPLSRVSIIPPPPSPNQWVYQLAVETVMIEGEAATATFVRSDRQTKTAAAARSGGDQSKWYVFDGVAWGRIDGPPVANNQLANRVEVVVRGGTTP